MSKIIESIIVKDNKTQKELAYKNEDENNRGLWYQVDPNPKSISILQLDSDKNRIIAYLFDYSIIEVKWK